MSVVERIKKFIFGKEEVPKEIGIDERKLINEIRRFKSSRKMADMNNGERYFVGKHDILQKTRTAIGENGKVLDINNIPNNKIVDNQYKKMVVQKANYLLGKPILFQTENNELSLCLKQIFGKKFDRMINYLGIDCFNCGVAYVYIYYDEEGKLCFKRFKPQEIIPIWKHEEHSEIEYCIRVYKKKYFDIELRSKEFVEVYDTKGILRYELVDGRLMFIEKMNYFYGYGNGFNWDKVPIIPFKYNKNEGDLLVMVKSLQDGINKILSSFSDVMEEDTRNSILVIVNYDGENLGEFRKNLSTYGVVKVQSIDGKDGDVRSLQVEVNAENYKAILQIFKRGIIENAMGYDAKDERFLGSANQMNIQSMYNDIDLDANGMELEFQASIENMLWFVLHHLYNYGIGEFYDEKIDVLFNKDMMMNEAEIIDNIKNSVGILSNKTLIEQHPWINDLAREEKRLEEENVKSKKEEI